MFTHYMFVDILFPLTKAIPIMFERVTELYKHGYAIMQRVNITSTRYHTLYHTFSLSLAWFGAICNKLPHVTVKFIKKCILIFIKKNDGNAW